MEESSVQFEMAKGLVESLLIPLWNSNSSISVDNGSIFNLGKKVVVWDGELQEGSSHRIQSSRVPKSKAWSCLISGEHSTLERWYPELGYINSLGDVGEVMGESYDSELQSAGSLHEFCR